MQNLKKKQKTFFLLLQKKNLIYGNVMLKTMKFGQLNLTCVTAQTLGPRIQADRISSLKENCFIKSSGFCKASARTGSLNSLVISL